MRVGLGEEGSPGGWCLVGRAGTGVRHVRRVSYGRKQVSTLGPNLRARASPGLHPGSLCAPLQSQPCPWEKRVTVTQASAGALLVSCQLTGGDARVPQNFGLSICTFECSGLPPRALGMVSDEQDGLAAIENPVRLNDFPVLKLGKLRQRVVDGLAQRRTA